MNDSFLTQSQFESLLDYSCSVPTGVVDGKQWKRCRVYGAPEHGWFLGEYVVDGVKYMIKWSRLVIVERELVREFLGLFDD